MECPPTGHGTFGEAGVKKREHLPGDLQARACNLVWTSTVNGLGQGFCSRSR